MRQDFHDLLTGSRSSREAAQLSLQSGLRSIFVRMRRAGFTFVGLFSALVLYTIVYGTGFFAFLLGIVAIFMLSFAALFLPVRTRRLRNGLVEGRVVSRGGKAKPLDQVTAGTRDWLLLDCRQLPRQASPAVDRIVARLRDLEPSLAAVAPDTALGSEAQRLIGQHLPNLVDTYLTLPEGERGAASVQSGRLSEALEIVAGQLDDLCERVADDRRRGFDTEHRFIETRYGENGPSPDRSR
jgi:hypothetical protein